MWSIDRIQCDSWRVEGDRAIAHASSEFGATCSFTLLRIPDKDVALVDFNLSDLAPEWWQVINPKDLEKRLLAETIKQLNEWNKSIENILTWIPIGAWKKGPENDYSLEYASLAYLKETLSKFGGLKTNSTLGDLLGVPVTTVVERIRECRNRNLLTAPGKGVRGTSTLTSKAMKLLEQKGVRSA